MWKEAAMIMVSAVLFIQMGLSEAVQEKLHFRCKILSCYKCLNFWLSLIYLGVKGYDFLAVIAVSFLFSYLALWLALLYDIAADFYNSTY